MGTTTGAAETDIAEVYIAMGRVLAAHGVRHRLRGKCKAASAWYERQKTERPWDFPEDGGTGWTSASVERAEAILNYAVARKVGAEKFLKKLRHAFAENYPNFVAELERRLDDQSRSHAARAA